MAKKIKVKKVANDIHPEQPMIKDPHGVLRFKQNAIIGWLFDSGRLDLNLIATLPFSTEDRRQIAQLLGYSVCGYLDLSYVYEDEDYANAVWDKMKVICQDDNNQ